MIVAMREGKESSMTTLRATEERRENTLRKMIFVSGPSSRSLQPRRRFELCAITQRKAIDIRYLKPEIDEFSNRIDADCLKHPQPII